MPGLREFVKSCFIAPRRCLGLLWGVGGLDGIGGCRGRSGGIDFCERYPWRVGKVLV